MMCMPPSALFLKIAATGVFLLAVMLGAYHQGEKGVQADWDASRAKQAEQATALLLENQKHNAEVRDTQEAYTRKLEEDHERALDELRKKYATDIDALNRAGGLRVPSSVCADSVRAGTEAASAFKSYEAATVRLPATVESRLFALAQAADEAALQCTQLQQWVKENGFYR